MTWLPPAFCCQPASGLCTYVHGETTREVVRSHRPEEANQNNWRCTAFEAASVGWCSAARRGCHLRQPVLEKKKVRQGIPSVLNHHKQRSPDFEGAAVKFKATRQQDARWNGSKPTFWENHVALVSFTALKSLQSLPLAVHQQSKRPRRLLGQGEEGQGAGEDQVCLEN